MTYYQNLKSKNVILKHYSNCTFFFKMLRYKLNIKKIIQ